MPLEGSLRRVEFPVSRETPSPVQRSVGTEGELWWLSEENSATGLWPARQSETCIDGLHHIPASPSLRKDMTVIYTKNSTHTKKY